MKNLFPWYIRLPLIFFLSAGILEYLIDSGELPAFMKYPEVAGLLMLILFLLIAFEICYSAISSVIWKSLSEEEKQKRLASSNPTWFTNLMKDLTKAKPVEQEEEIILNHNYDGIKELDNALPPWWVWGFYITIVFAVVYMAKYHMFGGESQAEEFEIEMAEAKLAIEEYKKTAKNLVDYKTATILTEAADLAKGKEIFIQNCAVCHKVDGGGSIGPNLTDKNWILGGGINNIFKTISEGGRPGKGMEPWSKNGMKSYEIQQVASYIMTLEGTNPEGGKAPEGDVWVDSNKKEETASVTEEVKDSIKVDTLKIK